jgi:hypothetical protein
MGRGKSHCQTACGWLTSLQCRNSLPDFIIARSQRGSDCRKFGNNRDRHRYATRSSAGGIFPTAGSLSHEIVDCAFRNVSCNSAARINKPIRNPSIEFLLRLMHAKEHIVAVEAFCDIESRNV